MASSICQNNNKTVDVREHNLGVEWSQEVSAQASESRPTKSFAHFVELVESCRQSGHLTTKG